MRIQTFPGIAGLVVAIASCQNPTAPPLVDAARPALVPPRVNLQTGQANRCRGEITSEIASDWPWPENKEDFPPPPGAVRRFLETFGPDIGVSSIREFQDLVCSGGE